MIEFPVKSLMTLELVRLLLEEKTKGGGLVSFNFSPLLGSFKLCW